MASLIAQLIVNINTKATNDEITFAQQFILKKGLKYKPQMASLIAQLIVDINTKATTNEIAFAQQFILKK